MSNSGGRGGSRRAPDRGQGLHGFPDPFGGFSGRSLFQDFFGEDPFSDPFFSQPFGGMFGPRSGFGAPAGFFGPSLFGGGFVGQQDPHGGFLEQRPYNQQPELRRGPVIEEVTGDHDHLPHSRSSDQPIVEHPDDEVRVAQPTTRTQSGSRNLVSEFGNRNASNRNSDSRGYSYQASSVTYSGPNGPYYSSSMRRRAGSDGVIEEELQEKDSSGKEEHRQTRGLGNKGLSTTRKRNADGREDSFQTLHNLSEEEATSFDKTWEAHAATSLPHPWNGRSGTATLPSSQPGSSRGRAALPSSGGSPSTWTGAKRARVDLQSCPVQKSAEIIELL